LKPRIAPGSTVGILGGGQLGRMLAMAARSLGYHVHTLSPEHDSPTGQISDVQINAAYSDLEAVRTFASHVDVVTFEFENIPVITAEAALSCAIVRPSPLALSVAQHRIREKTFLADLGISVTPSAAIRSDADLRDGIERIGCPAVLKTAALGYDGKGQVVVASPSEAPSAWETLGRTEAILEAFVELEREISVVGARGIDGDWSHFGPFENAHRDHILDVSVAPAGVTTALAMEAVDITRRIMGALDLVGLLCVEFFVARGGRLLVNELAPRPHNSGHLTIDACRTSQFEQLLRAICGLPLGSPEMLQPAAMANLLGDLWDDGEPNWAAALAFPNVKAHLYGKPTPRPGRKMGHLTALASTPAEAKSQVLAAREALTKRS
jgi:5-(carboxyamino)imidazole ribonucleotide synthase